MPRVTRASMLALQLSLLCTVLLLRKTDASGCALLCETEINKEDSESVSLWCDSAGINVTLSVSSDQVQSIELICTHSNHSNETVVDLLCDLERMDRFHSSAPSGTVIVNASSEGIPAGSMCSIRGCYLYDFDLTAMLATSSCILPRDCEWGMWSNWSECDRECGDGMQTRSRLIALTPVGDGRDCEGLSNESRPCYTKGCTEIVPTNPPDEVTCNSTVKCPQHAECVETLDGPQCTCLTGYLSNGSLCMGPDWKVGVLVMMAMLVFVIIVSAVGVVIRYVTARRRRGLDHKRVEKLMGTFDPNFTPHLSSNLRKVTAVSEISVFDNLWLHHSPSSSDKEYITLDELGICIHSNHNVRDTNSENSMELHIADYSDEETQANSVVHTVGGKRVVKGSSSHTSYDFDSRSNYSLDYQTVQTFFHLGYFCQNINYGSDENIKEDEQSVDSEPKDFVEDLLRIDIGEFSEAEEEEQYMSTESEPVALEQTDFVEGTLRVSTDEDYAHGKGGRDYLNIEGVCFTLPAGEHAEQDQCTGKSSDLHSSLSALNHDSLSSDSVSNSSPLSNSTPSLFIS